jgi:mannose-6-phosphate isomerase-like protein (cupin superfamily)
MRLLAGAGVPAAAGWAEHLRTADLSAGTYTLEAGAEDGQEPHTEDEIYVITAGRATLWTPAAGVEVGPGSVVFVPAGEPHWFVDITERLTALVVFGPAEYSRRAGGDAS